MENIADKFSHILDKDEQVLWTGKPVFLPFFLNGAWKGLLQMGMGVIWLLINRRFDENRTDQQPDFFWIFGAIFVAVGAWMILSKALSFGNCYYASTNRRVMIRSGIIGVNYKIIDYDKISDIEVTVNLFERATSTGTVRFFSGRTNTDSDNNTTKVYDRWEAIRDPYGAFKKVKETSVDIKTDYNYPNALRPGTNPGYTTKYEPGS